MSVESKVSQIVKLDTKEQTAKLSSLVDELVASGSVTGLKTIAQRVLSEDVLVQVAKPVAVHIAEAIKSLPEESFYDFACELVASIKQCSSSSSFDEADFLLRDALFSYCVNCEEYTEAAQYLAGANLDSNTRVFSDLEKVDLFIKCAEAVLEADEAIDAEIYVNKASALINAVSESKAGSEDIFGPVQLRFRVTYARVLDANRKFVEAAVRYYGLSTTTGYNVLQEDLLELLGKAVTCAILGKSGQQRSRVLALLVKDERLGELDTHTKYSAHRLVLQKMHREQIIRPAELEGFANVLMPHQKAVAGDGYSLLDKAVVEHNVAAAANIYRNISLEQLGALLGLEAGRAERVAAAMITEGRLRGFLDQTEGGGFLVFEERRDDVLASWDLGIEEICSDITAFVDTVTQQEVLSR